MERGETNERRLAKIKLSKVSLVHVGAGNVGRKSHIKKTTASWHTRKKRNQRIHPEG